MSWSNEGCFSGASIRRGRKEEKASSSANFWKKLQHVIANINLHSINICVEAPQSCEGLEMVQSSAWAFSSYTALMFNTLFTWNHCCDSKVPSRDVKFWQRKGASPDDFALPDTHRRETQTPIYTHPALGLHGGKGAAHTCVAPGREPSTAPSSGLQQRLLRAAQKWQILLHCVCEQAQGWGCCQLLPAELGLSQAS